MTDNKFKMVAKTFKGLEDVLEQELITLGAEDIEPGVRMVAFTGDLEMMYRANLCLRTALRILKPIDTFIADDTDELYDHVRDFDWEQYLGPDSTFSVDSTVNSAEFNHSKFVTYRVKDGIADHFSDKYGRRPSIRLIGAELQLNVHISGNQVTISLDSSGEPLNKRGYRVEQTEAPINEVLAAGIILKTGWHGECDFADPMCGSGTFLIEAALIAGNINPGIYRESFAFEKWPDFDADLFESLYNDDSAERDINCAILGGDISPEAVIIARKNIKAARLEQNISLVCEPMQQWDENERDGVLITNPPYGERLRPDDMATLYKQLGSTLKQHFQGWHAWILGYRDEHFAEIGLKPSVKYPILNGALECSLREYVLFGGRYNDFKADGGEITNHTFVRDYKPSRKYEDASSFRKSERKEFKRDFNHDGRKENKRDRKRDDKSDYGRDFKRDFKRDDRKDFKRDSRRDDRKEFKRDFKRDDRKEFKRDFKHDDRKEGFDYKPSGHGPRLGADKTTFDSHAVMRSRKRRDE